MESGSRRFGRYQPIRSLASGGMGEILLAEHTGISGFAKRVALKRIKPELARDPNYVRLFLNEARLGSFLNHPNIVHIFDVGHHGEDLWLVMEYVPGVDLKRLARRAERAGQPLSPPLVAAIAIEVLSALEEAHQGGPLGGSPIIHRDLSPENILVALNGSVKVLDFGLAKWMPEAHSVPSLEGNMIFGKVRYMPPEQLKGHLIDVRADLFSLAVVMYEVISGQLPFGRGSADEILRSILREDLGSPSHRHHHDPELDNIIFKALSPLPHNRFATASEMRHALLSYLHSKPEPRLPLEALRLMLSRAETAISHEAPTEFVHTKEIALPVPERCGKCGGTFVASFFEGLIIDRCNSCHGVWLDHEEVMRIIGDDSESVTALPNKPFRKAALDNLVGSCPTDKVALQSYKVPGHPASLEICPECLGIWFDEDEVQLLSQGDVVSWLRELLESLYHA